MKFVGNKWTVYNKKIIRCGVIQILDEVCPKGLISRVPERGAGDLHEGDVADLKLTSRVRRSEAGRRGWDARKPARDVIFRQMCGRGREIIALARSSWSSVRKCGRIIVVASLQAHAVLVRWHSLGMLVTEGQSQGRRNLAEDKDKWYVTSREKTFFLSHGISKIINLRFCSVLFIREIFIQVLYTSDFCVVSH